MNKRSIIAVACIAVVAVAVSTYIILVENQNPEVSCYGAEQGTSGWYMETGSPALSSYQYGAENFSSLPQVKLGVIIVNNNSQTIFNIVLEVRYRTDEDRWNTTSRIALGFLDIQEQRQTQITLANPYLILWNAKRPRYDGGTTTWENATVYVLNASDYRIRAYGFPHP